MHASAPQRPRTWQTGESVTGSESRYGELSMLASPALPCYAQTLFNDCVRLTVADSALLLPCRGRCWSGCGPSSCKTSSAPLHCPSLHPHFHPHPSPSLCRSSHPAAGASAQAAAVSAVSAAAVSAVSATAVNQRNPHQLPERWWPKQCRPVTYQRLLPPVLPFKQCRAPARRSRCVGPDYAMRCHTFEKTVNHNLQHV